MLDITGRFKPDFVIAHLFGRAPSVSIKELKGKGYPLSKVISLVWGASEADIKAAGGYEVAEGYHTMQFAGVGQDFQVIKDINAMYQAQGKPAPKEQETSVFYNRGLMIAALHVEAIRNAIKAKGGAKPTSEDVKNGMEAIKGFTLGGMVPPMAGDARGPRGRRLGAGVDRQGRQARQGRRVVPGLPRRDQEASAGHQLAVSPDVVQRRSGTLPLTLTLSPKRGEGTRTAGQTACCRSTTSRSSTTTSSWC